MHINTIRKMARKIDIDPRSMDKKELIRAIQTKEGNFPCFKTDQSFCDEYDCCWRNDCQPGTLIGIS